VEEEAPPPSAGGAGEEPAILRAALGSGKLRIEGSLSFKRAQAALQVETEISIRTAALPAPGPGPLPRGARFAGPAAADSPKHEGAALRLQKVYKSFRTRRQLADCAVLVEQSWWKLLDFALLKCSSVSFFEVVIWFFNKTKMTEYNFIYHAFPFQLQRGSLAGAADEAPMESVAMALLLRGTSLGEEEEEAGGTVLPEVPPVAAHIKLL
jgi:hypothetical protein